MSRYSLCKLRAEASSRVYSLRRYLHLTVFRGSKTLSCDALQANVFVMLIAFEYDKIPTSKRSHLPMIQGCRALMA